MQFKQKDGLVMWSQRPSPLPKVIPMCLMQSPSGIIGVAHWAILSADPRQIAWSLSTFKIASGWARWVRHDQHNRLVYPAELTDKKFDTVGHLMVHPDVGSMVKINSADGQSSQPEVEHLRMMCRHVATYPVLLLHDTC